MDVRLLLLAVGLVACKPGVEAPVHPQLEPVDEPTLVVPTFGAPGFTPPPGAEPPRCRGDRSWVKVSAGVVQTCGLHGNGCIECWGGEEYDGVVDAHDTAEWGDWVDYGDDEPPDGVFTDVAVSGGSAWGLGSEHACALDAVGNVICWGRNDEGQASPPAGAFTALSLAGRYSCGLRADTSVACWGGGGDLRQTEGSGYVAIAAGVDDMSCAAHASGFLTCWTGRYDEFEDRVGPFDSVALGGYELCASGVDTPLTCWGLYDGVDYVPDGFPGGAGHGEVCLGSWGYNGCVRALDGRVTCWGRDFRTAPDASFTQISCGSSHVCGLTEVGRIECWGECADGQCAVPR